MSRALDDAGPWEVLELHTSGTRAFRDTRGAAGVPRPRTVRTSEVRRVRQGSRLGDSAPEGLVTAPEPLQTHLI